MKRRHITRWSFFVLVVLTTTLLAESAFAQQGVIDLKASVIKGRIQKPEAFYILQHANLDYKALNPKPSFIPELLKTVTKKPF